MFSVVSIWKTLTPLSTSTLPMRQLLLCSSLWCWSMKLWLASIVAGLWWWRSDRYEASPTAVDFHPPSIATRLMLTYTSRSDSAARLLISTSSPWAVCRGTRACRGPRRRAGRAGRGHERVVHAVAEGVAQLGLGHPPVQGEGGDQVHVVDAGLGGEVEHGLDHPLAHVGPAHLRQRQAHVVEGDRQPHAREQQGRQRVLVDGMVEGVADGAVDVVERRQRLGGVDHPAAVGRQLLEAEALAAPEQRGRRRAVDVEDESGSRHLSFVSRPPLSWRSLARIICRFLAQVEGDLDGAASAGGSGVGDGVDVIGEGIGGREPALGLDGVGGLEGESNVRTRRRRRRLRAVGVGADELGLAVPQPGEVERDLGRHAHQHHAAARAGDGEGVGDRARAADGVDGGVGARRQVVADHLAADEAPDGARQLGGGHDLVGAEAAGFALLVGVAGADHDAAGARSGRGRRPRPGPSCRRRARRPPVGGRTAPAAAFRRGVDAAGERLDEHGPFVGDVVADAVQLGVVGHQFGRPAAAGGAAEPGLDPGVERTGGEWA